MTSSSALSPPSNHPLLRQRQFRRLDLRARKPPQRTAEMLGEPSPPFGHAGWRGRKQHMRRVAHQVHRPRRRRDQAFQRRVVAFARMRLHERLDAGALALRGVMRPALPARHVALRHAQELGHMALLDPVQAPVAAEGASDGEITRQGAPALGRGPPAAAGRAIGRIEPRDPVHAISNLTIPFAALGNDMRGRSGVIHHVFAPATRRPRCVASALRAGTTARRAPARRNSANAGTPREVRRRGALVRVALLRP